MLLAATFRATDGMKSCLSREVRARESELAPSLRALLDMFEPVDGESLGLIPNARKVGAAARDAKLGAKHVRSAVRAIII